MSLWWARKEQLDKHQIALIEDLPVWGDYLVLGPPGSGKTNVLLRRAQFVRGQEMPNVMVLTFTRSLTEFVRTGCFDAQAREIFPQACVSTLESWIRWLYEKHERELPERLNNLPEWKTVLATGALDLIDETRLPRYDALFVDEAQDLMPEEIRLLRQWGRSLFFVGDDRERIYAHTTGLNAVRQVVPPANERVLSFHYRLAPELCRMADRILQAQGGDGPAATCHYDGPKPGSIEVNGPLSKDEQLARCAAKLRDQVRVYADLIQQGDRLGIIVARREERDRVFQYLEQDPVLAGNSKIIRARTDEREAYDPSFDPNAPICILTVQACKGLEFRALHWLFAEELKYHHSLEHYYTVCHQSKNRFRYLLYNEITT